MSSTALPQPANTPGGSRRSRLVLTRKEGEGFWLGDDIYVAVQEVTGGKVRIKIEAPRDLPVARDELVTRTGRVGT